VLQLHEIRGCSEWFVKIRSNVRRQLGGLPRAEVNPDERDHDGLAVRGCLMRARGEVLLGMRYVPLDLEDTPGVVDPIRGRDSVPEG
jgi:hypothetical protein